MESQTKSPNTLPPRTRITKKQKQEIYEYFPNNDLQQTLSRIKQKSDKVKYIQAAIKEDLNIEISTNTCYKLLNTKLIKINIPGTNDFICEYA